MSQLAPPGSSSYNSATLHVGDGTWDSGRDDFLLPPLVGLNFATMRYNGMGNRFYTMTGYHSLIEAHGILAAITFLGCVPAAMFLMRFYGRNPRMALRLHIWLQILTLLLSTVIIALGFFAVGPRRRLTNPHHGIGLAIYVLIWVQVIGGWLVHRSEKRKRHLYIPLKAMIHHWLGRAIALLGITQIALGLTLYGSPAFLFVLYTLAAFGLFLAYFILEWLAERRRSRHVDGGSYYSDEVVEEIPDRQHGGIGKYAAVGAAGLGLAALWNRRRNREREDANVVQGTESGTGTSYLSEKYSDDSREHHGWGRRILEISAIGGGLAAVRSLFKRRNESSSDVGPYRPPLGGNQTVASDSISRIEEGRPPMVQPMPPQGASPGYIRPSHPLANSPLTPGRRNSEGGSSMDYSSYLSGSPSRRDRRSHGFRDALAVGGAAFAVRSLFKNRRQKKEEARIERERIDRAEAERIQRMNDVGRYTGEGVRPPRLMRTRMESQTDSEFSNSIVNDSRRPGPPPMGINPLVAGGVGAAAGAALADRDRIRPVGQDPVINTSQGRINTNSHSQIVYPGPPGTLPTDIPPLPPIHRQDVDVSSGSEMYTTASGRQRHRHHLRDDAAAGLGSAAVGAAAMDAASRRRHSGRNTDSAGSQYPITPVSVHVKQHSDGRHVTLRRLTEEEAAAEAARQQAAAGGVEMGGPGLAGPSTRRRRNSSFSSSSGGEALGTGTNRRDGRYRRMEAMEAEQQAQAQQQQAVYPPPPPPGTSQMGGLDPPLQPPLMGQQGSVVTSPGTEGSGATEYANNRRRRRAERAQARLAREGRGQGNTVEFS